MIKINLLSVVKAKKARKADQAKVQFFLGVMSLVAVGLLAGWGWIWLDSKIASLTDEKGKKQRELTELQEKVKEVESLEAQKKNLEDKIKIIEQLKKNQSGPVVLLEELSKTLPSRVWVTSLVESQGKIDLEGKATTNAELVEFVDNMKSSGHFTDIQFLESRAAIESNLTVFTFRLKLTFISS